MNNREIEMMLIDSNNFDEFLKKMVESPFVSKNDIEMSRDIWNEYWSKYQDEVKE